MGAAVDLLRKGKTREAQRACESRLAAAHDDVEAASLLADIHLSAGRAATAADLLRQVTQRLPQDAAAQRRLAGALLLAGRPGEAVQPLRLAIAIEPGSARAHNNLGQALMQLGQWPEAILSCREALHLDPDYAIAHHNLGTALAASGALTEADKSFRYALTLAPRMVQAWLGRGGLLVQRQLFTEALECFESALRIRPGDVATLIQKALVLLSLERPADSLECADQALSIDDGSAQAHNARAGALRRLNRRMEALQCLDRALSIDPGYAEAWCNHGMILHETGDHNGASNSYRQAVALNPGDLQARTRLIASHIPSVPASAADTRAARRIFDKALLELESWLGSTILGAEDALTVAQQQFFYLAYDDVLNRPLLERYRGACAARLATLNLVGGPLRNSSVAAAAVAPEPKRFKLGFISAHVHNHSVFHAILRGWLKRLDRGNFEIHLFSLGSLHDDFTREARGLVDQFASGPKPTREWLRIIREHDLDAVIYPELGMNHTALALAATRLAPRQFAAWGHPETSGLPTIDGYLSGDLFEPPQAQDHYTEALIRLPNLGVHCEPHSPPSTGGDLSSLGIPNRGPLFICPGVPFKYRPQHDRILVDIARRLGHATFVFFQHASGELSRKLHERMARAFRNAGIDPTDHLRTIPWQPRAAFFALLRQADVYLDTIGFSGFNTMMQALECRLPCVTHRGEFMRGRLGSGILRRVGLAELVASDHEKYVELAVKIAEDQIYRARIRESLELNTATAFGDVDAVNSLARLLLSGRPCA